MTERQASQAVFLLGLIILSINNLPYLCGWKLTPPTHVYSGIIVASDDTFSYMAKMRQGYEGNWRYENRYTTEPNRPSLLFMFYLFLGHAARWSGLSIFAVFHIARLLGGILLMAGTDRLLRAMAMNPPARVIAFALAFTACGLGWLVGPFHPAKEPLEYWMAEGYSFQTMMTFPHLACSSALMVWAFAEMLVYGRGGGSALIPAGLAVVSFLLAWVHPRLLMPILLVGAAVAICGWQMKSWTLRRWVAALGAIAAAGSVPSLLILHSYRGDPAWEEWAATVTSTPSPIWLLEAYGLLWPLAVLGSAMAIRRRAPGLILPIAWIVIGCVLVYLPIISQRRLTQGMNLPLAFLCGYALGEYQNPEVAAWSRVSANGRALLAGAVCLLLSISTWSYTWIAIKPSLEGRYPWYYAAARSEAFEWLRVHTKRRDTVLCSYESGMAIPAMAGNRVVLGHWAETLRRNEKEKEVKAFFDPSLHGETREEILNRYGVRYIFQSQFERMLGNYDPLGEPEKWELVYRNQSARIFKRRRGGE